MSDVVPFPEQVGHLVPTIAVTNVDRSVAFYRAHLGLEVTFTNGQPTGFVILRNGAAELHLTLVRNHQPGNHNVAHVLVDDAESRFKKWTLRASE